MPQGQTAVSAYVVTVEGKLSAGLEEAGAYGRSTRYMRVRIPDLKRPNELVFS